MPETNHSDNSDIQYNKLIDVQKVIAGKNPRLARLLPRFVIRYLKKIIHEDVINKHLHDHRNYYGLDFVYASLEHFGVRLIVHGLEHLDMEDRILVASNHPLGGLDGLGLMAAVGLKKPDLVFPVNDLLLSLPNLRDWFIPVNKHGSHPKDAVKLFEEVMASDKTVLFFPAGLVSRRRKGIIADLEWKKTFVTKAKKFNRKIIPVYIDGENSKFFYNLANLRKLLRIKTNIEMLYLVDEMYKQYNKEMNIFIGKPLQDRDLPAGMKDEELASYIRSLVYTLPSSDMFHDQNKHIVHYKLSISTHATTD
jgi:1-acyl-sn-glycerol-3-phosphate acyltransferase